MPPEATVECELCPKLCRIAPGESGECRVRVNLDGRLLSVVYGHPCAVHVDPIEKKPLFHFLPGSRILSLATVGCNLRCRNCQNWEISQCNPEDREHYALSPAEVVALSRREDCASVAFTYTDPSVYFEYARDSGRRAREAGLKSVLVTAGYLNPAPARELLSTADAANVDLKFIHDDLYRRVTGGHLAPVQSYLKLAVEAGVWLEVTNLVIPTLNDSEEDLAALARWVRRHLGPDVPLHFSRFSPRYEMNRLPPTPPATLERARALALAEGLRYVYVGNVRGGASSHTWCPACGRLLIERVGFRVVRDHLQAGRCGDCGRAIPGVWADAVVPPEAPGGGDD